jgi:WD40 repeat protein
MNLLQVVQTSYEEGTYVMDGCLCSGGSSLALSLSTQAIRLYDTQAATFLADIKEHTQPIRDLASTPAQPSLLYSCQQDCGVMVSDLRQAKAVHFLTDMCSSGATCSSISISPSGEMLAVSADRDIHFVDTRTWTSVKCLEQLHVDEISRLRFLDEQVLCSAGEDQMINFLSVADGVVDDDVLLQAVNCGEVVSRMNCFPDVSVTAMVGTCENGYIFPYDLEQKETRYLRPNFDTYLVDWCVVSGQLHLVSGVRDDNGDAGPLQVLNWTTQRTQVLPRVHKEIGRVAIGFGNRLITGGEDGMLVYWKDGELLPSEVTTSVGSSAHHTGGGKTWATSKTAASSPGGRGGRGGGGVRRSGRGKPY